MGKAAYMAKYMLKRYHERRAIVIERLGGKCQTCGSSEQLEIDHIDRTTKKHEVSKIWGCSWQRFNAELDKCQLLCVDCHGIKSILESGRRPARGTHGTLSAAKYCGPPRCEACKAAQRTSPSYMKRLKGNKTPRSHGRLSMYKHGCRCVLCKEANTIHMRNYRAKLNG